ncbi:hypothetical protein MBLNU230_g7873t1 [Neophaeotheca triangularis]
MGFTSPFKASSAAQPEGNDINLGDERKDGVHETQVPTSDDASETSEDFQPGVKKIEATTQVWSKSHLITAYILIWIIFFISALQSSVSGAMRPYVTSAFQQHSATAAVDIMSSIVGGVSKLPLAKVLDIYGRPQGYALMMFCLTLGLVMMAGCNNVETYAAAQVFYWVGYNGLDYTMGIFIADTTHLKHRGFMFAYSSSPYIITTWIGGPLATAFLNGPGFRWGFGAFSIIQPVACAPLLALFLYNQRKAQKAGLLPVVDSGRTKLQSLKYYAIQFDLIGLVLVCAGIALFLLPFSLYSYQPEGWESPMIIGMLVAGVVLLGMFAAYEKFLAPVQFIPFHLLKDRTILGSNVLAATIFVSFYIWDSYFNSFLQVVPGLNITETSYVANIYSIGSCFWSLVTGAWIAYFGKFKNISLFFGLPFTVLGVALMIIFRQPDVNIGYIVMCQIFIAFAGGTLVICEQVACMAAVSHQFVTVVLAIQGMCASIGGAIGMTVAGAVWTGTFPQRLQSYLPEDEKENYLAIYADLTTQLSYPQGTPARDAISRAYGDAQKFMLIGGTAVLAIAFVAVACWRDIDVRKNKQVKGRVI